MVKKRVQKVKRKRAKAAKGGDSSPADNGAAEGPEPPAHVKRKLARQAQFMQQIVDNRPAALSARSSLRKKKKGKRKPVSAALGDLSLLSASLAEAAAAAEAAQQTPRRTSKSSGLGAGGSKQRTRITNTETDRLQQVLKHPQFLADPIAAVTAHLTATMPAAPAAPKPKRDAAAQKRRKRQKGSAQSMDTA